MWASAGIWLAALACLSHAAETTGNLYIHEATTQRNQPRSKTISPESARLIIASRLGLDRYHEIGSGTKDTLEALNDFAGSQQLLLGGSTQQPVALLWAQAHDAVDVLNHFEGQQKQTRITIKPTTSLQATNELFGSLVIQAGWNVGQSTRSAAVNAALHMLRPGETVTFDSGLIRVLAPEESLKSTLETLASQEYTIITLVMPNSTAAVADYGSFSLPHYVQHAKRQNKEALLADLADFASTILPDSATLSPMAKSNSSSNFSTPLKGILPQCFSSLSACQTMTRNCTGHGSCGLKFTDKDASESGQPCYTCSCTAEVRTNKDGTKKTTNWGGPACQKKDVVAPFWLLAGFSVFLMFLVSWGIGLLWTMGDADLPSVIGAGVSGVPRR